ncbi:hypothetical protein NDU88_006135 [Pleurodeles waltl]|uniref:Uncharacterized protein n=1 Tax=Pleurodeles waltl TaxID=8319 RepID=A0AAV7TYM7_PLEWA|nr:hypothetical protein NDU88_006135 [Pleurodeles waltl]
MRDVSSGNNFMMMSDEELGCTSTKRREMCYDVLCCHGAVGVRNGMWEREQRFGWGQLDVTSKKEGDILVRGNKPCGLP